MVKAQRGSREPRRSRRSGGGRSVREGARRVSRRAFLKAVGTGALGLVALGTAPGLRPLGSVPIAVIYTFVVDHYVSGLTAGAVKR